MEEKRDNKKRRAFCVLCSCAAQGLAELFARERSLRQNTWPFQPDGANRGAAADRLFSTLFKVKLYMTVILYVAPRTASSTFYAASVSLAVQT